MKFSGLIYVTLILLGASTILSAVEVLKKGPIVRKELMNPGLDVQVPIMPVKKRRSDVSYTVVKLPLNATLYYAGQKIEEGYSLTDPNKVTIDPDDGDVAVVFSYTATDAQGNVSEPRNIIMRFLDVEISGSVFHDFDGNGIVDGERISNLEGEPLYVTVINKENKILASKAVSKEGRFHFNNSDGIQPNTNYALIIGIQKDIFASVLPKKWSSSGENINSQKKGKDVRKDGIIVVKVRESDVTDIDFGLDIRPVAVSKVASVLLNPGADVQVAVPKLEGSDKENGKKVRFYLTSLPDNAVLYNKGKKVEKAGIEIKDPAGLSVDPKDGDQNVTLQYVTADFIGVISFPASIEMGFRGLSISGSVFEDGNADEHVNGKAISKLDGTQLYATLLDDKKKILASKAVAKNGSYQFGSLDGIRPDSEYSIVLSTKENATASELPQMWNYASEGWQQAKKGLDKKCDGVVMLTVKDTALKEVDFGLNKTPEAVAQNIDVQLNPGANIQVPVPTLQGKDNESVDSLTYTIVTLPDNATLYYRGKKITKPNFRVKDPSKLTLDPKDGVTNVSFSYLVTDVAGVSSGAVAVNIPFKELLLSGYLLNDGTLDENVSGPRLSEINGKPLYVLLLDTKKRLLSAKKIDNEGSFSFDGKDGVMPESLFFLALSTAPKVDAFGLPEGWSHTGEKINSMPASEVDKADGVIRVPVQKEHISQIDFGINEKPKANSIISKSQLNPGLDVQVNVPVLSGEDRESGTRLIYKIKTLPTLGTLYYEGEKIEKAGLTVVNTAALKIDPENSDLVVLFTYVTIDEAGIESDPARVEMPFVGLHIAGRVVNDGDGDKKIKGKPIKIPKRLKPYATLLDANQSILASNPLTRDGTFTFDGSDGVYPNADFTVVISLKKNSLVPVLPQGWVESGETDADDNESKDSTSDGKFTVHIYNKSIDTLEFGINKKPIAKSIKVDAQVNPGGERKVAVPHLSGSDRESGEVLRYMIKKLPQNATLYNGDKVVLAGDYVDPKILLVDPKDGKQVVRFTYVSVDPEEIQSDDANVTMRFTGLSISGTVFMDFIVDGIVDSSTTIAEEKIKLFVTLVSGKGEVMASVPVVKGTYVLDESTGVNGNTKYRLVLSKEPNSTFSILPEGWHYADGENVNSLGKGTDGKADGMIDVMVKESDLKQVDFSINFLLQ